MDGIDLDGHDLAHAVRADLLRRSGRVTEAAAACDAAISRTSNGAQRRFLAWRRAQLSA